jgi:hypothetical protein
MSNKSDLLKSIIKRQVTESPALDRFLKSRGLNPKTVTKDQKVSHSKMGQFKKWQRDHAADLVKENHIAIAMGNMLDDEGSMVLNQIEELERGCAMIRSYIGKDYEKQLPAWVQSKVTLATDYMSTVGNYLSSKNENVKESYNGPRGDKLIAVSHAAYDTGDKEKSSRAHKLAMKAGEKYRSNPVNRDKAISHIMSGANKDYTSGKTRTNDSVEIDGKPIQEGSAALRLAQALRKEREARELKDKSREAAEKNEKARQQPVQQQEAALEDPQSATQSPYDCANNPDDTVPKGKKLIQMSKSARIIKSIYKRKGMKEEIYDTEKEGKSIATYGKKPKLSDNEKKIEAVGGKPQAAAIMTGGTTLTGTPRDTVEIDPMMKPPKPGSLGQSDKPKNNNR